MGIPIGAVRQALQKEGKDPNIIDMIPTKTFDSRAHGNDVGSGKKAVSPALKDDPEFSKFFKVLRFYLLFIIGGLSFFIH